MKKTILVFVTYLCLTVALSAQSINITSIVTNPTTVSPVSGGAITVNYEYTSTNNDNDIIYIALELHDGSIWNATIDEIILNPVAKGTNLTGSVSLTIPNTATPTANLTGNLNYKVKLELNDSGWGDIDTKYSSEVILLAPNDLLYMTSIDKSPTSVNANTGGNVTVNYQYTSSNNNDIIYVALELRDTNNNWISTVDEVILNPVAMGTNVSMSTVLTIPNTTTLTANLPANTSYKIKISLNNSGWQVIEEEFSSEIVLIKALNHGVFAKGADVSWMTEMEASGRKWYDDNGVEKQLMPILQEHGMNSIRLRVWVDPTSASSGEAFGWCDIPDMVNKAVLANNLGMDVMITIHYSDWWADPGKQNKPTAWENFSTPQLIQAVYDHTTDVLTALGNAGVTPKWVQIGNETDSGMLWDTGKTTTTQGKINYADFVTSGNNAVKDFNDDIITVVHVSRGNDTNRFHNNIGSLINNGAQFDIIGMSLYPTETNWQTLVDGLTYTIGEMQSTYGKEVIVAEVGMRDDQPTACKQFLDYIIAETRKVNGLGVFYWEPQSYWWKSYGKSAWESDGSPSIAMDAFLEEVLGNKKGKGRNNLHKSNAFSDIKIYPNPASNKLFINSKSNIQSLKIVDLLGKEIKVITHSTKIESVDVSDLANGVYIIKINKYTQFKFVKK
ncbi:glycosyl hydrolase 53 family protein [Mariniflexile soesokkakense]|uniref:Arabinogalactan endo-beta-1,4-galactanase n=1 Tax=Mariniflexile soesokkakense TaxID=1343160 RepID=A0ABV0ABU0_9FLAO